ncbi:MAG: beta-N-acetylhexosaminidase [Cytophagales bacterium]|nr:beta-N-acetylhexosaminidase [Cytophagales bacterium]
MKTLRMTMLKILTIVLVIFVVMACESPQEELPGPIHIVPIPLEMTVDKGYFQVGGNTVIHTVGTDLGPVPGYVKEYFDELTGKDLTIQDGESISKGYIRLELTGAVAGNEAYEISSSRKGVSVKASTAHGLFYGLQTIKQLVQQDSKGNYVIPAVMIKDAPRFGYRGMHLDVGRHFYPVDFIKKYIDLIALHKMNTFHWHLTEDQGWRIEIKKYPKLTEIGAYRKETVVGHASHSKAYDGIPYGGFYTQQQVKEIVKYAGDRFITVIPEIEMPGHSQAVLAAYPELACKPGPYEVATTWGVMKDVLCPTEETFSFLQDVLTEVMALFPSEYIHIGADECPKDRWKESQYAQDLIKREGLKDEHELQSYFVRRIEKFLNANDRKLVGWDEILEGGLSPNATVMSWRGEKGGIEAAKQGHDVIMSPTTYCYFDYYQADPETEELSIGGFLPVEKVYGYEPIPAELDADQAKYILGGQGNVWTEYMKTSKRVEYMALPRMSALAEVLWSPGDKKDYNHFVKRMGSFRKHLDAMEVNYARHIFQD